MTIVTPILISDVPHVWPEAMKWLKPALDLIEDRTDEATVYTEIMMGTQLLWVAFDPDTKDVKAYATSKIYEEPKARVLLVYMMGGKDVRDWIGQGIAAFEEYGRSMDCSILNFQGRKGWKILEPHGFKQEAVIYQKDI